MRILIVPGTNSLSHFLKALAIKKYFIQHAKVHATIAISKHFLTFAKYFNETCDIIPNVQETDFSNFPTPKWFSNRSIVENCINEERILISNFKPDLVVGIFNFTIKISAQLENVPFYGLSCGCMLSSTKTVLGFEELDINWKIQKEYLDSFFKYLTAKMNKSLKDTTNIKLNDIRECVEGEKTFLWDYHEFMPIPEYSNTKHLGPILIKNFFPEANDSNINYDYKKEYVIISFGTCNFGKTITARLVKILTDLHYNVIIPNGYQNLLEKVINPNGKVLYANNLPLLTLLPKASLLITHGGQMSLFEAILSKVPSLIIPFQPEQNHNGLCIEKINCGSRLFKPKPFNSQPNYFVNEFNSLSEKQIISIILSIINDVEMKKNLINQSNIIKRYDSLKKLISEITKI